MILNPDSLNLRGAGVDDFGLGRPSLIKVGVCVGVRGVMGREGLISARPWKAPGAEEQEWNSLGTLATLEMEELLRSL